MTWTVMHDSSAKLDPYRYIIGEMEEIKLRGLVMAQYGYDPLEEKGCCGETWSDYYAEHGGDLRTMTARIRNCAPTVNGGWEERRAEVEDWDAVHDADEGTVPFMNPLRMMQALEVRTIVRTIFPTDGETESITESPPWQPPAYESLADFLARDDVLVMEA